MENKLNPQLGATEEQIFDAVFGSTTEKIPCLGCSKPVNNAYGLCVKCENRWISYAKKGGLI